MNCGQFEELMSEYLDGGMARAERRAFAEHLLACRPCRALFDDLRETVTVCHQLKDAAQGQAFERQLLMATTAGEMLSCQTLDALISDYFEGLIESSNEELFESHFAVCGQCRQLVAGVRASLEESEAAEISAALHHRILAATSGVRR